MRPHLLIAVSVMATLAMIGYNAEDTEMAQSRTFALLGVNRSTYEDIMARLKALGPMYVHDFTYHSREHGTVIVMGEVGLVVDPKGDRR